MDIKNTTDSSKDTTVYVGNVAVMPENELKDLLNTVNSLKQEKEILEKKYTTLLEQKEKEHAEEVSRLNNQIKELNAEIKQLNTIISDLKRQNKDLDNRVQSLEQIYKRIDSQMRADRHKLLVGSIAYNFIDSLTQFVFGKEKLKLLRLTLRSVEDIRKAQKTTEEMKRWEQYEDMWVQYKLEGYIDTYEAILKKFSKNRVSIAHPNSITEDEPVEPKPKELEEVVEETYRSMKKGKKTVLISNSKAIIHILDQLTRRTQRPILK